MKSVNMGPFIAENIYHLTKTSKTNRPCKLTFCFNSQLPVPFLLKNATKLFSRITSSSKVLN